MTQSKDKKQIKAKVRNSLKTVRNNLADIGIFNQDQNQALSSATFQIDEWIRQCNEQVKEYQKLRESDPDTFKRVDFALDIGSQNVNILNQKFSLVQFFCEDIYKRIELLGKNVVALSDSVEMLLGASSGSEDSKSSKRVSDSLKK